MPYRHVKTMPTDRRKFIKTGAATSLIVAAPHIAKAENGDNNTIKIGLIGCGGRGTGAANQALKADPNVRLWALADAFPEQVDRAVANLSGNPAYAKRIDVPKERRFAGLDAYQQLVDSGVDVVLIATPPGFRPQHLRAAIEAGKHVFAEKPMAVDMAGIHSVLQSAKLADEKKLTIQHGYCWRFHPGTRAGYAQVHRGDIGAVRAVYGTYLSSPVRPLANDARKPDGMSDVEWQVRNWINFDWLSGGPLVEQAIHTVDKIAWAMGDALPVAAVANGGKHQRSDPGNIYDNYFIAYEYPDNVFCHVAQRQYKGCHTEVIDRVNCEGGIMVGPGKNYVKDTDNKMVWRYRAERGEEQDMYQVEHNELFAALRAGKHINAGVYMANSTALGILGREAAHTGQRVTWDQLMASGQDMAPDDLKMSDSFEIAPLPMAGSTKLA